MTQRNSLIILAALAAPLFGCARHAAKVAGPAAAGGPEPQALQASAPPVESADAEPSMRGTLLHAVSDLKPVHFTYDSSMLSAEDAAVLRANADWLKDHAAATVQVAGHCDQRGTVEYNLALGQRRAKAVRDYYKMLGVAPGRIATISYGKEKPLCEEMEDACWARSRRGETLVAFPEAVSKAP